MGYGEGYVEHKFALAFVTSNLDGSVWGPTLQLFVFVQEPLVIFRWSLVFF